MKDNEENKADIQYDYFAVPDSEKSKSEGKTIYQKEVYERALNYARNRLLVFQENNNIKLPLVFKHEKMKFERGELLTKNPETIKKCWDFLDELNVGLKNFLNKSDQ